MIKLGVNTVLFAGYDLETALRHIALAGYDSAELSAIRGMCEHLILDDWPSRADSIRNLAEDNGLELTAMEVASLDEARLQKAFEAAAHLGIGVINVGPGGKAGSDEDLARQIDLLAGLAARAHDHGVALCVKAHVGQSIHDTPTTLRAMAAIDSPGFGIDVDPSHIFRAAGGEDVVEALEAVMSRVRHVHIRDCPAAARATEGPPGPPGGADLRPRRHRPGGSAASPAPGRGWTPPSTWRSSAQRSTSSRGWSPSPPRAAATSTPAGGRPKARPDRPWDRSGPHLLRRRAIPGSPCRRGRAGGSPPARPGRRGGALGAAGKPACHTPLSRGDRGERRWRHSSRPWTV